ncbi:MAG: hypothetical protein AAB250_19525 [Bdellovibrionota bacterium]
MSRLHDVNENPKLKSMLVGVQTPGVTTAELEGSLKELSRLVTTLGYEVSGKTTQKRPGSGGPLVLGDGKVAQIARLTGGPGPSAVGFQVPNALNPKLTKARLKREATGEWTDGPILDDEDDDENGDKNSDGDQTETDDGTETSNAEPPTAADSSAPMEELNFDKPDVIIFDCELTPSQMRNLQQAFGVDVLDRTGVIIEIFSRHARTRAARLQVEIARLTYLAPRVRETGGGSDRQGGGGKGAGESAIELDKRKIRDRIKELKTEFESIASEQDTRRTRRSEVRTVALVGYTNAGKSSMMRAMTGS